MKMKFRVTMKCPDALDSAIEQAAEEECAMAGDADEQAFCRASTTKKLDRLCESWFEYQESVTLEIDTDAQTCVVVPVGE